MGGAPTCKENIEAGSSSHTLCEYPLSAYRMSKVLSTYGLSLEGKDWLVGVG